MAKVREVLTDGAESLRKESSQWDFTQEDKKSLQELVRDMRATMHAEGGVGLAAPQIGVNKRIFIVEVKGADRYPGLPPVPFQVFVNPEVLKVSRKIGYFVEGCLSVPGQRIKLGRPKELWVRWQDETGRTYRKKLKGTLARIFQHELDHLDGILFTDYFQPREP